MECGGCGRTLRASAMVCRDCGWKRPTDVEVTTAPSLPLPPPSPPPPAVVVVATLSQISDVESEPVSTGGLSAPMIPIRGGPEQSTLDSHAVQDGNISASSPPKKWLFAGLGVVLIAGAIGYFLYAKNESETIAKNAENERIRLEDLATESRLEIEKTKRDAAKREQELANQIAAERARTANALAANQASVAASAPVSNDTSAPSPDVKIGEAWTYQTIDPSTGKKLSQFTYEVVGLSTQEIEVRSASPTDFINGRPFRFTREWNLVTFPQPNGAYREYSRPLQTFSFPLLVGKTWKSETLATNSVTKNQVSIKISGRVDGTDYVTTPAGKYSSYRVVVEQLSEPIAQNASVLKATEVYWYAPAIRRIVRQERTATQIDSNKTERSVTELLIHDRK